MFSACTFVQGVWYFRCVHSLSKIQSFSLSCSLSLSFPLTHSQTSTSSLSFSSSLFHCAIVSLLLSIWVKSNAVLVNINQSNWDTHICGVWECALSKFLCVADHRGGDRADHVGARVQGGCPRAYLGKQWWQWPQLPQQWSFRRQPAFARLHSVIQVSRSSHPLGRSVKSSCHISEIVSWPWLSKCLLSNSPRL